MESKIKNVLISGMVVALVVTSLLAFTSIESKKASIQISDFEAYMIEDVALVTLMTASEARGSEVMLEKSSDGRNFETVRTFKLNGSESKYTFVDENPNFGVSYYRVTDEGAAINDITPLVNHDGPINFDVSKEGDLFRLSTNHPSDQTYLISLSDDKGTHYLLESYTFNSSTPAVIDASELEINSNELVVHVHSTDWSTDKKIKL